MNKQKISSFLRNVGLAMVADKARYHVMKYKNRKKNRAFKEAHPGVVLPPDYLVYESFQLDYTKYYVGGQEDAQWVIDTVKPYIDLVNCNVLDWGCGPARILRHMPDVLGKTNAYYGTDYNPVTIAWCKENLPGISFNQNGLQPPLPYAEMFFKLIYSISVLTHLSHAVQAPWLRELHRILTHDGILLITTAGEAFMEKLTEEELRSFQQHQLITRENVVEGHRMYSTFHPPSYMKQMMTECGFELVRHLPGRKVHDAYISQDVWLVKRAAISQPSE